MSVVMKLQERGQVTLPKKLREDLGLRPGDSVIAVPDGTGGYRLERLALMTLDEMYEKWGNKELTSADEVERMIQAAHEEEADEAVRRFLEV